MNEIIIMVVLAVITFIAAFVCFFYPKKIQNFAEEYYKKRNIKLLATWSQSKFNLYSIYFTGIVAAVMFLAMLLGVFVYFMYPQSHIH